MIEKEERNEGMPVKDGAEYLNRTGKERIGSRIEQQDAQARELEVQQSETERVEGQYLGETIWTEGDQGLGVSLFVVNPGDRGGVNGGYLNRFGDIHLLVSGRNLVFEVQWESQAKRKKFCARQGLVLFEMGTLRCSANTISGSGFRTSHCSDQC